VSLAADRLRLVAALLFGAAPFGFGLIRASSSARDLRMLWMAFAAAMGTAAVLAIAKRPGGSRPAVIRRSVLILVVATTLAAGTAYLLGARAASGIWLVALVLAGCFAVSAAFAARQAD